MNPKRISISHVRKSFGSIEILAWVCACTWAWVFVYSAIPYFERRTSLTTEKWRENPKHPFAHTFGHLVWNVRCRDVIVMKYSNESRNRVVCTSGLNRGKSANDNVIHTHLHWIIFVNFHHRAQVKKTMCLPFSLSRWRERCSRWLWVGKYLLLSFNNKNRLCSS